MTVRKTLIVLVAALIAIPLIIGGLRAAQVDSQSAQQPTQAAQTNPQQAATQEPTPAATGISALGSVAAETVIPLYFQTSGTVQGVYVNPGDFVKTGDVLADLDSSDAWNTYNQAELSLENAQISLDTLNQPPSDSDLRVARANLASAQAAYSSAANPVTSDQITSAQLKYQQSQDQLTALQQERANMSGSPDEISLQEAKIGQASFNAEIARLQLVADQTPNSTAAWQASLRITQAQLNLDKLMAGPTQAQLDSAQLAIQKAEASVADAQTTLTHMQLIAPHDGYVTAVNVKAGGTAGAQTEAIELSDLSQLRITVPVNELDVDKVVEGASATIQLDALPGVTIPGKVEKVGWLSTTSSDGIVTYDVRVALTSTDPRVRIGMTGEVEIDTGSGS